MVTAVKCFW